MEVNETGLYILAKTFRDAIEKAQKAGDFYKDMVFCKFPAACCGDTACLLGQYLLEHNIESQYVCGNYYGDDRCQSHAWVRVGNIIIDITGDQFKYRPEFLYYNIPVFVGRSDSMHRIFEVEERDVHNTAPIKNLGSFAAPRLLALYDIIKRHIN